MDMLEFLIRMWILTLGKLSHHRDLCTYSTVSRESSKMFHRCWAWWFTAVIPAVGRPRQEDGEFKVRLGYIVRPCPKKKGLPKPDASSSHL
jgi:hypothetical protein